MTSALNSGTRSGGAQSTTALKDAISPPAKPSPIRRRAPTSMSADPPAANRTEPNAETMSRQACTRRGPNRSSSTPSGSWKAPKPNR